MKTMREIGAEQGSVSFRDIAERYSASTLRELIDSDSSSIAFSYMGYTFERTDSAISIQNKDGEKSEFKLDDTPLTPGQRKTVLDKSWEDIKKFARDNWEKIKDGQMKAADIGGALFSSVAGAILIVIAPFAKMGPLGDVLALPFVTLAANRGRYFGAAVDELVAILKDESDLTKRDVIGVLATVGVVMSYFAPVGALVPLGGTTAWELTVSVGKWVGGAVEDALDEIKKVPVVGDVVGVGEDIVEGVGKFFDSIF